MPLRPLPLRPAARAIKAAAMAVLAVALLGLMACSATQPRTKIFTIDMPVPDARPAEAGGARLAVLVKAPRYLQQPYVAYRNSPYMLELARYSKWDAPPSDTVAGAIMDALSATGRFREMRVFNNAPKGYHTLRIHLRKFERTEEGGSPVGLLQVDVALSAPGGGDSLRKTYSAAPALKGRDFDDMAEGLSHALREITARVRDDVLRALGALD